jgi:hypothetical protein
MLVIFVPYCQCLVQQWQACLGLPDVPIRRGQHGQPRCQVLLCSRGSPGSETLSDVDDPGVALPLCRLDRAPVQNPACYKERKSLLRCQR